MSDASLRALLINAHGSFTADYESLTGPVDSVARFGQLLDWYIGKKGGLNPLGGPGQVWVIGPQACQQLGWWTEDPKAIHDMLVAAVAALRPTGWNLLGELENVSPQLLLVKKVQITERDPKTGEALINDRTGKPRTHTERRMVQLILEPYAEAITKRSEIGLLEDLPEDDEAAAREVGRRVVWLTEQLGVLPTVAAATTGQRIQDEVYKARKARRDGRKAKGEEAAKSDAIVEAPGTIPGFHVPAGDEGAGAVGVDEFEPAAHWGRPHIEPSEIPDECDLLLLDQTAAYLATAGSIELGFGEVFHLEGKDAVSRLFAASTARSTDKNDPSSKWPFGIFRAVLPAGNSIKSRQLPKNLPLPHPLMHKDHEVTAWITTESVRGLCRAVEAGGGGYRLEDLAIDEAHVWTDSRRFLEDWAATLRSARVAAILAGDKAVQDYIGAIYKQYVGRMGTDKWGPSKMHHWQPVWRAAIIAHCRWRARRQAMDLYFKTGELLGAGLWPIYTYTDSWRYLVPTGLSLAPTPGEILERLKAGEKPRLGQLIEEDRTPLTQEQRELLIASTTGEEVSAVVYGRSGIPTLPMQDSSAATTATTESPALIDKPTPETTAQEHSERDEAPARARRGKGQRKRTYVGNRLGELEAEVSPGAVRDLEYLVETGKFSYLPDGVNHVSRTHERPAASKEVVKRTEETPVPDTGTEGKELQPIWRRPAVIYTAATVAVLLIIAILVITLIVI